MRKLMIVGTALAMGVLSVGAVSASTASSCCKDGSCSDKQILQKVAQETEGVTNILRVKEIELRELYGRDGMDSQRVAELESEIQRLKSKVKLVEEKYGISPCCRG